MGQVLVGAGGGRARGRIATVDGGHVGISRAQSRIFFHDPRIIPDLRVCAELAQSLLAPACVRPPTTRCPSDVIAA
eukprot:7388716-Prymnesium_polylepis.1